MFDFLNFKGIIEQLVLIGIAIGAGVVLLVAFGIPWIWSLIKPFLHSITA